MTNTEIVDNNRLIAEFMGGKIGKGGTNKNPAYINVPITHPDGQTQKWTLAAKELRYNTSWDWLMPVIDKIKNECEEPEELDSLKDVIWWGTISDVYKEVCELIKQS